MPDRAQFNTKYKLPFILAFFAPDEVTTRGVRVAFTDCSPKHLPLYGPIGHTPYGPPFPDPVFGLKVPILTVGGDLKLLQERRSPLLKACAPYGDDAEARHWFERNVQNRLALAA